MIGVGWNFPVLSGGGEEGYASNDIEAFKGEELYVNLARETCQNSLDARVPNSNEPVLVKFELREFDVAAYSFFTQYKECIKNCRKYWNSRPDGIPDRLEHLLNKAHRAISADKISALIVSDYNTPGLLGSKSKPMSGSFNALVYAEGVSYKKSDTSAGSFGIGRNAPFACSALSCVCYNTKATDGGQAFAGVAKLATTLNSDSKPTRKQGRYQYNDDENGEWRAIEPSDNDEFAAQFKRNEYGTDVIILGFERSEDWQKQLETAVLKNFFLAIHERRLVVEIQGKTIDSQSIADIFQEYINDADMHLTYQYYRTLVDSSTIHYDLDILNSNDAELFIRTDAEIDALKNVAWFRSSGMLIRSYRPQGIFRPYVAVFIARGDLDKTLRDTEPARHNDWDYKRIEAGTEARSNANRAITKLKKAIKNRLKEVCESAIDDSIDAIGAADYLPDSIDGHPQEGGGTDAMRPLIQLGKIHKSTPRIPTERLPGKHATGAETDGTITNHRNHPDPKSTPEPSRPVTNSGDSQGIAPGKGGKTIRRQVSGHRRIFALSPTQGVYRLIIIPDESAEKVIAMCSIVGENGTSDPVRIKSAMLKGKHIGITSDGTGIGPFSIKQGERTSLTITFEEQGSMAFAVDLRIERDQQ